MTWEKISFDWGDMCNLAFIAAKILNCQPGQASPKFKIVAAMNAKLHISPQLEEMFLPMQTLTCKWHHIKKSSPLKKSPWKNTNFTYEKNKSLLVELMMMISFIKDYDWHRWMLSLLLFQLSKKAQGGPKFCKFLIHY